MGGNRKKGPRQIDRQGIDQSQLTRTFPCTEKLSKNQKISLDRLVKNYMKFIDQNKTNFETTESVIELAEKKGYSGTNANKLILENREKTAYALIRKCKKPLEEGVRIIYTHTDSPCLKVKPVPTRFEWDGDWMDHHLGVELSIIPYGGITNYHWLARDLDVRGYTIQKNGKVRKINFDATVHDTSAHVDDNESDTEMDDAFSWENIVLVTGHESEKALLKFLKFESRNDFARSKFYAVPPEKSQLRENNYVVAYGHDDRVCTYAAQKALLSMKDDPTYTSIVIGFDNEEIGSVGDGGAGANFFEEIIRKVCAKHKKIKPTEVTWGLFEEIKNNSYAISGDVDVGSGRLEARKTDIGNMDLFSTPKLGYGVTISAHDGATDCNQINISYMDKLINLFEEKKVRFQVNGSVHNADYADSGAQQASFFTNRGIPTIEIGVPTNGLHSPRETIHGGDLYWMLKAYEVFLNDKKK